MAGLATLDQALPFQCSVSGSKAAHVEVGQYMPTAQALPGEMALTACSIAVDTGSAALDQILPFQCRSCCPTAQASVLESALMPVIGPGAAVTSGARTAAWTAGPASRPHRAAQPTVTSPDRAF